MTQQQIREAIVKAREFVRSHPDEARYTDSIATATVESGLRVRVEGPNGAVIYSDMPGGVGGSGSAPSPGWLMRAAHAACDATLIAMRAAEEGIELSRLEVIVDSQSDDRGLLDATDGVPSGPLSTRVRIVVAADGVSADRLQEMIAWAREHSPVDDAMCRAVPVSLEIEAADG